MAGPTCEHGRTRCSPLARRTAPPAASSSASFALLLVWAVVTLATVARPAYASAAVSAFPPHRPSPGGGSANVNTGKASGNRNLAQVGSPTVVRGDQGEFLGVMVQTSTQDGSCRRHVERCAIELDTWLHRSSRGERHRR
ncbi:hypothetical protein GCM10009530_45780 [Microbispora corallina]|uniref:Uncharacterized protein n=1 Tax=Microbispora corallina TaxID=83302 RepID=A0ABQ4FWG6_9ACTN|nr:hypothetical protein [Microbispora corallina]GIH39163.1 hypothetical protein Mco01_21630 [Microbispora corallina]